MAAAKRQAPASVEAYLASFAPEMRAAPQTLRETIRSVVPDATERISYQIPTFMHHGPLVAYAAFNDHYGFYVMRPALMEAHAEDLKGYATNKASIRFDPTKPLPKALVKRLVKARVAEKEQRSVKR